VSGLKLEKALLQELRKRRIFELKMLCMIKDEIKWGGVGKMRR
jgi:hypothetical protein